MKRSDLIRSAVEWIALNDEPTDLDPDNISEYISTLLVADLLGEPPHKIAKSVVRHRRGTRRRRARKWIEDQRKGD